MLTWCQRGVALRRNLSSIRGCLTRIFIASFGTVDARPELADSREWLMRAAFTVPTPSTLCAVCLSGIMFSLFPTWLQSQTSFKVTQLRSPIRTYPYYRIGREPLLAVCVCPTQCPNPQKNPLAPKQKTSRRTPGCPHGASSTCSWNKHSHHTHSRRRVFRVNLAASKPPPREPSFLQTARWHPCRNADALSMPGRLSGIRNTLQHLPIGSFR
jgi:hypothetical protein